MSSYKKTVEQWNKNHALTLEDVQRIAKEKATNRIYKENGEFYLEPRQYQEIFKKWPEYEHNSEVSYCEYEAAVKKRIEEYSKDKKKFYNTIVESRHK